MPPTPDAPVILTPAATLVELDKVLRHGWGELRVVVADGLIVSLATTTTQVRKVAKR
jgi:hypothetical protein